METNTSRAMSAEAVLQSEEEEGSKRPVRYMSKVGHWRHRLLEEYM